MNADTIRVNFIAYNKIENALKFLQKYFKYMYMQQQKHKGNKLGHYVKKLKIETPMSLSF